MTNWLFGCGYLGQRVAELWRHAGEDVLIFTRSREKARRLQAAGFTTRVTNLTDSNQLRSCRDLPPPKTVLFAVGWDRTPGQSIGQVYVQGFRQVLEQLPSGVERVIYISSTGVFGAGQGDWVNELSPCEPLREGGQACLAAEQVLQNHALKDRGLILRLAGIYGPGRIPRAADLQAGLPIAAPSQGYLNLIHVDDAARIVLLAEQLAKPPRTYLVSDGHPVLRAEYYAELARLLAAPPPQFTEPHPQSPASQRAASDKRICNARLQDELKPAWLYPSYREGLAAIVQASRTA